MRLTLKDDGYPFKKIMKGRQWIGRVVKTADGRYYGRIGKTEAYAATERQAFEEVAARWFGHDSAAALDQSNARIRASNRQRKREQEERIRPAKEALARGDYKTFFEEFGKAIDRDLSGLD